MEVTWIHRVRSDIMKWADLFRLIQLIVLYQVGVRVLTVVSLMVRLYLAMIVKMELCYQIP